MSTERLRRPIAAAELALALFTGGVALVNFEDAASNSAMVQTVSSEMSQGAEPSGIGNIRIGDYQGVAGAESDAAWGFTGVTALLTIEGFRRYRQGQ